MLLKHKNKFEIEYKTVCLFTSKVDIFYVTSYTSKGKGLFVQTNEVCAPELKAEK